VTDTPVKKPYPANRKSRELLDGPTGRQRLIVGMSALLADPALPLATYKELAERSNVAGATISKHFASIAQVFDVLIEFVETSTDSIAAQVIQRTPAGPLRQGRIAAGILQFLSKNPATARLLHGDVLVREKPRLLERTGAWWAALPALVGETRADLIAGRCSLYVISRFKRRPDLRLDAVLAELEAQEEQLW